MSFDLIIKREAQIDLDEAFIWYEERKENLGFEFISEVENCFNKIIFNPYYASLIEEDARAASIKRFPYHIIYRVDESKNQIRVIAISHQHRSPDWFKERLGI
jgi:plasmid stabilization system protein ParE